MQASDLISMVLSIVALIVSACTSYYNKRSADSAKKSSEEARLANHYSRLEWLISLKALYEKKMNIDILKKHEMLKGTVAHKRVLDELADYGEKLSEVNKEIERYHSDIIKSRR